jgi:hypothetical protein
MPPAPPDRNATVAAGPLTLGRVARDLTGHASPWLLALFLSGALAARLAAGGWSWWDLLVPAVVLALEPFIEWVVHVSLLHFRPRALGPWRIEPYVARKHRAHHADPKDPALVFVPLPDLLLLTAAATALPLLLAPAALAWTVTLSILAMLTAYEWIHFLIHTPYRPRHAPYRALWRAHRNHHYRNERYWFGVTTHLGDRVLGTFPPRAAVPVSDTARTLGVSEA